MPERELIIPGLAVSAETLLILALLTDRAAKPAVVGAVILLATMVAMSMLL